MTDAALVLLAYLTGSIPMAYLVGRAARKIDIRRYGSGNAGASNVWVQVGKRTALSVGAFDVFVKGSLPAYLAWEFGTGPWVAAAAGIATVVGHNWSAYLGLTGGRGVTVATGVMLVLAWKELIALLLVALAGWLLFRSNALWVGIAVALTPVWSMALGDPAYVTVVCAGLVLLLAAKRVLSNGEWPSQDVALYRTVYRRLLYDRDASSRDEWVNRRPPEN